MKQELLDKIAEINTFIADYRASKVLDPDADEALNFCYKHYHAILIWQNSIDNDVSEANEIKLYLNEATADLSSAVLCSLLHLYKPSRMTLRSSIENLMRVVVLLDKRAALSAKSTYELSVLFNSGNLLTNKIISNSVQSCLRKYDKLCKYVHTSTPMHMDHRIPFAELTKPIKKEFIDCLNDTGEICQDLNSPL